MEIEHLRQEIDRIDDELVELLNRRAVFAKQIGEIKIRNGWEIQDPNREGLVLERIVRGNGGPLGPGDLRSIFTQIMIACRHLQQPSQELA